MNHYSSSFRPISTQPRPVERNQRRHTTDSDLHGSPSPAMSSHSTSENEEHFTDQRSKQDGRLKRPKLPHRMSSSTIIVPRDTPNIELTDEEYGPGDARTMSPRRTSEEVDRLGESARQALIQQAKELQDSLLQIVDKVESVKTEHEKLEGGNRFLQSYIGELMQTSKITATGSSKSKGKGKSSK